MTFAPARTLASAGTAGAGALTGTAAYLIVGGLAGVLYAAGIVLAAVVGVRAIRAGRHTVAVPELEAALRTPRWRRAPRVAVKKEEPVAVPATVPAEPVQVTDPEALARASELEEHRAALANLGAQMARESEAAGRDMQRLETRIRELEAERDSALALIAQERARFERTLDALCDGIGAELAELEPALEALIPG